MRDLAELIKSFAWPMVVTVSILLFANQLKDLISALSKKIERAKHVKITHAGIELAEEVARSRFSPLIFDQRQSHDNLTAEFNELIIKYDNLAIACHEERVVIRTRVSDRLGELAILLKISRAELALAGSEGKIVALATLTIRKPMAKDLAHLEKAAQKSTFRFTRYRILLGLLPILAKVQPNSSRLAQIINVLDLVENVSGSPPDDDLQRLIDKIRNTITSLRD